MSKSKNHAARPLDGMVVQERARAASKSVTMVKYARLSCALQRLGLPAKRIVDRVKLLCEELALATDDIRELEEAIIDCGDSPAAQQEVARAMRSKHGVESTGRGGHGGVIGRTASERVTECRRLRRKRLESLPTVEPPSFPSMGVKEAAVVFCEFVAEARSELELGRAELASGSLDSKERTHVRRACERLKNDLEFLGCT